MTVVAIGQALDRKDALPKVTGKAVYAAEHPVPDVVHAVTVQSTIAKGRIVSIDTRAAAQRPGVLTILTHANATKLADAADAGMIGEDRQPLQDDLVHYDGQHIAVVVADTLERALDAALLVKATYEAQRPDVELEETLDAGFAPEKFLTEDELQVRRGEITAGLTAGAVQIERIYSTPVEHHNPMEPHATIASWDGDELTLRETTQGLYNMRGIIAKAFGLPPQKVHVISPYVGGGFGCKGFVWPHTMLAAMAARETGRAVKLVLSRQQMFSVIGHRGRTVQMISLAAAKDGRLTALRHATATETSEVSTFMEPCGLASTMLYAVPNIAVTHKVARVNKGSPTPTRAPGEATGPFALESAMDELAYELGIDPIELRVRNHADVDPSNGKAFSSKHLLECYRRGAEAFGWSRRTPQPRSMRDGRHLIGFGMATATYPANRRSAAVDMTLFADGQLRVRCGTQDLGTGTYTIVAQVAADVMGVPIGQVHCEIGDSRFPNGGISGGSSTAASVGPAVEAAARTLRAKLAELAVHDPRAVAHGRAEDQLAFAEGRILLNERGGGASDLYTDILRRANRPSLEAHVSLDPTGTDAAKLHGAVSPGNDGKPEEPFSWHSFGAQFAEVRVDPDLGEVRVSRFVSVQDIGRVLNHKTARSQIQGGVVWGLGMALMEHTVFDRRNARIVTRNLADYLVPVNPDVPDIEVIFIDEPDPHFNALGARGIGEIGITGVAAALANAVYHATGKRVRDLPITPDLLI